MHSQPKFEQIGIENWPSGLSVPAALISLLPNEISRRARLEFSTDVDELDEVDAAILNFGHFGTLALEHHLNAPVQGTVILTSEGDYRPLRQLVDVLALKEDDLIWTAEAAKTEFLRIFADDPLIRRSARLFPVDRGPGGVAVNLRHGRGKAGRGSRGLAKPRS